MEEISGNNLVGKFALLAATVTSSSSCNSLTYAGDRFSKILSAIFPTRFTDVRLSVEETEMTAGKLCVARYPF